MRASGKYQFLDILHEAEGVARGAHLVEKVNRSVFNKIKEHSTAEHARNNNLFHIETEVPEVINMDRRARVGILERLIQDRVVCQIFRLDYDIDASGVELHPCFITHQSDESDDLKRIYQENIQRSVNAVELFLGSLPLCKREEILADLELDFKSPDQPQASEFRATLVEPFKDIHASKFDVLPGPEMIQQTIQDIELELVKRNKLIELLNYGMLFYREQEAVDRIECAAEILNQKILPHYQGTGELKKNLSSIKLDEESWRVDAHQAPTTRYDVRRADALKQAVLAQPGRSGSGTRFPGSLATEVMLSLAGLTENLIKKKHKLDNLSQYENYRQQLLNVDQNWQQALLALDEEERLAMPQESWRNLVDDLELFYRRWETPQGSYHVFIKRDAAVFKLLIQNMGMLSEGQSWRILAMKSILEENESELPEIFSDSNLVTAYGQLLRRVYMKYIPWLYRILMFLGLRFAQDNGFKIAKQSISLEQEQLRNANKEKTDEVIRQREKQKQLEREQLKLNGQSREVQEQLDWFYYERNLIPSIAEVRSTLKEMDLRTFEGVVEKAGFQKIKVPDKNSDQEKILLYPIDSEWSKRIVRLGHVADKILQTPDLSSANKQQATRARLLRKFLEKARQAPESSEEEQGKDPYEEFANEIHKVKAKDKQSAADAIDDELIDL